MYSERALPEISVYWHVDSLTRLFCGSQGFDFVLYFLTVLRGVLRLVVFRHGDSSEMCLKNEYAETKTV